MSRTVFFALALLSLVVATPAYAVLITVNFTVTGDPNDSANAGVSATGSFSFDSSIIPQGGGIIPPGATTGFNLTWDGTTWTEANASLVTLEFNSSKELIAFNAFGDVAGNLLFTQPFAVDDFRILGPEFVYSREGDTGVTYTGSITWTTTTGDAPEPSAWMLLAAGLPALVGSIRRIRLA